jgi:hypothetical protein
MAEGVMVSPHFICHAATMPNPPVLWGSDHPAWKGDDVQYVAFHERVRRRRGDAYECVWGCMAKKYEWANLTGDYANPGDYAMMCTSCHTRYDQTLRTMASDFSGKKRADAVLTECIVREARLRRSRGERVIALAHEFGVTPPSMSEAIRGKTWAWVR